LASVWLDAPDRNAVTAAALAIDRELSEDAAAKGMEVSEGLRVFYESPLRALFVVREEDRSQLTMAENVLPPFEASPT